MMVERVQRFQVPEARPRAGRGPLLTVIIVNYNGWSDVLRLVEELAATAEVAMGVCEVVVVDNSSQGPIPGELSRPRPGIRLIVRDDNGGFAVGVNAGWRVARSRWLLVLNPDVEVPEGALEQVVARAERYEADPDTAPGVIGFGLRNPDGSRQPSVGTFPSLSRTFREQLIPRSRRKYQPGWRIRPGSVAWVTGACMLVNSRLLDVLGGMDEDFFLYHEEVALCRSAHGLGWRVDYDPSVEVVHLRPLQNRAISPKNARHHPAQQAPLLPQIPVGMGIPGALLDHLGRGGCAGGLVEDLEKGRRRSRMADDRRGGAGLPRGTSAEGA